MQQWQEIDNIAEDANSTQVKHDDLLIFCRNIY